MTDRDHLRQLLDRLDAQVADAWREDADRNAFWPTFAASSDEVLAAAGTEHFDWASAEIAEILRRHGIPVPEA